MSQTLRIGIIGGSGLGESLARGFPSANVHHEYPDTPFGRTSGPITLGEVGGVPVALLARHGEGHVLNPATVPYRANIFALKQFGCTHIIASGACGSLRETIAPGDLVVCDQLIDRTNRRDATFYEQAAVHVEFADPFCSLMRRWLLDAASRVSEINVHQQGAYVCMEGPSFSTRAESNMHRQWGADIVGMTALPEARLAREAEIAYVLIALPTDYDCWRPREAHADEQSLITEIIGNLQRATDAAVSLVREALTDVAALRVEPSPAHEALKLAIWSDKAKIDPTEVNRLAPLWGRYFP